MTRLYYFPLSILLYFSSCYGQEVIASDGNYFDSGQGSLSWTLGEMVTETISDGLNTFTQGFQQNYEDILALDDIPSLYSFSVYPNPFMESILLSSDFKGGNVGVELFDLHGRSVMTRIILLPSGISTRPIDLCFLAPGLYQLKITTEELSSSLHYSLIKSH